MVLHRIISAALHTMICIVVAFWAASASAHWMFQPHQVPIENKDVYAHPYPHPVPEQWKTPEYVGDSAIFYRPMLGKHYLDFCFKHNKFCGRSAANKFCKKQGFAFASRFFIKRNIGKTVTIGDKRTHYARRDGFRLIKCRSANAMPMAEHEPVMMDKFGKKKKHRG